MTSISALGEALVAARNALGLSQRELAERLGVHQQQIARWEKERYACVSLSRVSRVADVLGVGVEMHGGRAEQPLLAAEPTVTYGRPVLGRSSVAAPVRDLGEVVARIRAHADELHDRYGVTSIDVFGSFARGEQTPESDVDLIVEIAEPGVETVLGSRERLTEILGRKADTGTFASLRPRVQPYVARERVGVWHA